MQLRLRARLWSVLLAVVLSSFVAQRANASPWTLPRGQIALVGGYNFQTARKEFIGRGDAQLFPLRGRYTGTAYFLDLRAGYSDRLELEILMPFKTVEYTSDPVILLTPASPTLDNYQSNVIDLSRSAQGLGDLTLSGRYRWLLEPFALATELKLKTPTGYDKPSGTFGNRPRSADQFLAQVGDLARSDRVEDDVTLGDGQVDLTLSMLLGASFSTRTFLRADAGYNLRLQGAGDQVVSAFKVGQSIGPYVLVYAGGQLAYTVEQGKVLGISVVAQDPSLPARDYGGLTNLTLRARRLERDALDAGGGFIVRVTPEVELNANYTRTMWGGNTSLVHSVSLSLGVRAQVM